MKAPPLGPGGENINWPDQVAPRNPKASSTPKLKPPTSNLTILVHPHSACALVEVGLRDILEPGPLWRGWCKASVRVGTLVL